MPGELVISTTSEWSNGGVQQEHLRHVQCAIRGIYIDRDLAIGTVLCLSLADVLLTLLPFIVWFPFVYTQPIDRESCSEGGPFFEKVITCHLNALIANNRLLIHSTLSESVNLLLVFMQKPTGFLGVVVTRERLVLAWMHDRVQERRTRVVHLRWGWGDLVFLWGLEVVPSPLRGLAVLVFWHVSEELPEARAIGVSPMACFHVIKLRTDMAGFWKESRAIVQLHGQVLLMQVLAPTLRYLPTVPEETVLARKVTFPF